MTSFNITTGNDQRRVAIRLGNGWTLSCVTGRGAGLRDGLVEIAPMSPEGQLAPTVVRQAYILDEEVGGDEVLAVLTWLSGIGSVEWTPALDKQWGEAVVKGLSSLL